MLDKMLYLSLVLSLISVCLSEDLEYDVGYSLSIGHAIDVFANYGDLSQVTQVISADYEAQDYEDDENSRQQPIQPFNERNIKVFVNATSQRTKGPGLEDKIKIHLCDTFDDLLSVYFKSFKIEGADDPWKAFLSDWSLDEIERTLGLDYYQTYQDNCCYVLAKITKTYATVTLNNITENIALKDYVNDALNNLDLSNMSELRRFMTSYGTHYIDSYTTGNFVYQIFKYKRHGYNILKTYLSSRRRNLHNQSSTEDLRFYFSSYFLRQVGDIRLASGNKTVESWAKTNLRDSQYLYSRPSLLKLYHVPTLFDKLDDLLNNEALLALDLKTLRPIFKNQTEGNMFAEVVENDLKLWEVNV